MNAPWVLMIAPEMAEFARILQIRTLVVAQLTTWMFRSTVLIVQDVNVNDVSCFWITFLIIKEKTFYAHFHTKKFFLRIITLFSVLTRLCFNIHSPFSDSLFLLRSFFLLTTQIFELLHL